VVYILAGLVAGILVYRIAQASRRLHAGFSAVQAGNFSHRARLRGNDQLSELIASFNHMVGRLEDGMKARAEREAIDRELRVARDLQRSLLPSPNFRAPGFEIAVDFMPAAEIGGDFYDLIEQPDGRLLVAIADVSGHGLSTGIVMSAAKVLLSALIADGCTATKLFERLDREILLMTDRRAFVTLALCAFDPALGKVEFTNAGQVYPYRVTASGRVESLSNPSRPLGVALPARFVTVSADWDVEDLWVLASDAIIEARNRAGEVFGFESFEAALAACAGNSACEARDRILAVWQAFTCCELPEDDRTLIVLRREPTLAAVPDPRATY
jgi:phosphoserine phosphatase RsbU/P